MRAWRVERLGEPSEVLSLAANVDPPEPAADELRVQVRAAAIGMPDVFMCRGTYAFAPPLPFTPGQEVCGVVTAAGADAAGFPIGTRVMGVTRFPSGHGGFAEEALLGATTAFAVPDAMSDADAAGFSIGWSTAWVALVRRAQLAVGEQLLVLGAAGGSGATAVQIGAALGAHVIAVVGDDAKARYCRDLGAEIVIDRRTGDVAETVRAATEGCGATVIYDPVGGAPGEAAMRCIANEGRFLAVGFAAGRWPEVDVGRLVGRNASVLGVYVGAYSRAEAEHDHDELVALFEAGHIRSCVTDGVPFAELPAAIERVARGEVVGKTVVLL
ncbi:MAG: NADPH:quinone oxidoreductase family protein [Acidimicrobiia bacterium]